MYAISHHHATYRSHLMLFWNTAEGVLVNGVRTITADINGAHMSFTVHDVRRLLRFEGELDEYPTLLPRRLVAGCLMRMGYEGRIPQTGLIKKNFVSPMFKTFFHVLIHCLSPRKGGFDDLHEELQSAAVALTLNLPYNFS